MKFILILLALLLVGCSSDKTIEIRNCEYIIVNIDNVLQTGYAINEDYDLALVKGIYIYLEIEENLIAEDDVEVVRYDIVNTSGVLSSYCVYDEQEIIYKEK